MADGFNLTTIELDEGQKIPTNLNEFDGMFCMGGPMDTYMEKEFPWLVEEKKRIKEFVIDLKKLISPGAVNKPTAQVNITNDITLGFISLSSSKKIDVSNSEILFALEL